MPEIRDVRKAVGAFRERLPEQLGSVCEILTVILSSRTNGKLACRDISADLYLVYLCCDGELS